MNRILEKLRDSEETEFESDNYIDLNDSENEELRWSNRDDLYEVAESVPESVVDYGVERFVQDGEFSLGQFTEALEKANELWISYRERDEHNPRTVSEREARAYGAGAADLSFITNSPRRSSRVEKEVDQITENMKRQFEGLHDNLDTQKMMSSLLGPEEIAQAELLLRNETDVYKD